MSLKSEIAELNKQALVHVGGEDFTECVNWPLTWKVTALENLTELKKPPFLAEWVLAHGCCEIKTAARYREALLYQEWGDDPMGEWHGKNV